ncbi:hypothetical protein NQZ68_004975 [Dissostichus eleginoides]|nr:hypothetical protein NQZ68_004975 [Dissostichus eleginoides]
MDGMRTALSKEQQGEMRTKGMRRVRPPKQMLLPLPDLNSHRPVLAPATHTGPIVGAVCGQDISVE